MQRLWYASLANQSISKCLYSNALHKNLTIETTTWNRILTLPCVQFQPLSNIATHSNFTHFITLTALLICFIKRVNYIFTFHNFWLEDNCFTILCWFLPYIITNQPWVHRCPLSLEPTSHLPRLQAVTEKWVELSVQTANSLWLSILPMVMYMSSCHWSQLLLNNI